MRIAVGAVRERCGAGKVRAANNLRTLIAFLKLRENTHLDQSILFQFFFRIQLHDVPGVAGNHTGNSGG